MKALVLAAGFGTRLLPHTSIRPKPLFTLNGITVLQHSIEQLIKAGCTDIIINTHHRHHQIEKFIENYKPKNDFSVNISTIHEPEILETGGAIKNVRHFMGNDHFIVINSDIVSDIDLRAMWNFHIKNAIAANCCATLALHDYHIHNKVTVDKNLFVRNFSGKNVPEAVHDPAHELQSGNNCSNTACAKPSTDYKVLAFTGIQVLSPEIFDHMPDNGDKMRIAPFSSIDLYSGLAGKGDLVKAFICKDIFWQDIGTPETYRDAAIRFSAHYHLNEDYNSLKHIKTQKLAGDGSDRGWYRCRLAGSSGMSCQQKPVIEDPQKPVAADKTETSLVVADHGVHCNPYEDRTAYKPKEIDSFIRIGKHLLEKGIPVPEIKSYDRFAGLVVLEDLGDIHLQDVIRILAANRQSSGIDCHPISENRQSSGTNFDSIPANNHLIFEWYKKVCRLAISFSMDGIKDFDDAWTFQTPSYSKEMILEKECLYFVEAFLQGYLEQKIGFDSLRREFEFIADNALEHACDGLMHRDMQSRNIMVKADNKDLNSQASLHRFFNSQDGLDNSSLFFIDFQSARRGPLQYDLASLLIDPYVNLEDKIRETLLHECAHEVERVTGKDADNFIRSYRYCALARNMQMLGAFSHLSMNRGKTFFEQYIPVAVENLKKNTSYTDIDKTGYLYQCIRSL
ncbi:MAG: NTP transferase domain-containing protein [Desulfamplus sp.]|nr:NTP transferase domain-containing protein [Desulfamplus sp.]